MGDDNRTIEYLPLADLITRLHPQNPKEHNIGGIIQAYQDHGYVEHGTLDNRTGLFLAGHGRTIALDMMKKQGIAAPEGIRVNGNDWLVPVNVGYSSKSDVQALAYLAASNQLTIDGGWDEPALAELLQEVANSTDIDITATGYNADDLDELLRDLGQLGDNWKDAFSGLSTEDRQPFQQVTFTLHDSQIETVKEAILKAKHLGDFDTQNENSNGNALDRICQMFMAVQNGNG
jgi:hypothetical protein